MDSGKRCWQGIYFAHKIIFSQSYRNLCEKYNKELFCSGVGKFLKSFISQVCTEKSMVGMNAEQISLTRNLFVECLLLLKHTNIDSIILCEIFIQIGTLLKDTLFSQQVSHSDSFRHNLAQYYQDIVIALAESIALSTFDLWLTIGVSGIGDYQKSVRLLTVNGFRLLVPLAPLAMNLHKRSSVVSSSLSSEPGLFQQLLTKSNPKRLNESADLIDQSIVRILIALNSIFLPFLSTSTSGSGVRLRSYQWDGISWWTTLRRCGLSGILADEM
jgi:hypothetical protein